MRCALAVFVVAALVVACTKPKPVPTETVETPSATPTARTIPTTDECPAPPNTKPLPTWAPPGCTPKNSLGPDGIPSPLIIGSVSFPHSDREIADAFDCHGAPSGIDFEKEHLLVLRFPDTPAFAGLDAYDSGDKVVFVAKSASCPNRPPPHPGPDHTIAFRVPNGSRTFDKQACTMHPKCD